MVFSFPVRLKNIDLSSVVRICRLAKISQQAAREAIVALALTPVAISMAHTW